MDGPVTLVKVSITIVYFLPWLTGVWESVNLKVIYIDFELGSATHSLCVYFSSL